jgi:hypothetical protein
MMRRYAQKIGSCRACCGDISGRRISRAAPP